MNVHLAAELSRSRGGTIDDWVRKLCEVDVPPFVNFEQLSRAQRARYQKFIAEVDRHVPSGLNPGIRGGTLGSGLEDWAWQCVRAYVGRFEPWRLVGSGRAPEVAAQHRLVLLEPFERDVEPKGPGLPDSEDVLSLVESARNLGLSDAPGASFDRSVRCWLFLHALARHRALSEAFIALAPFHRGDARPVRMVVRVSTLSVCSSNPWLLPPCLVRRTRVEGVDYWTLRDVSLRQGGRTEIVPQSDVERVVSTSDHSAASNSEHMSAKDFFGVDSVLKRLPPLPRDGIPLALSPTTVEGLNHLRVRWAHRDKVEAASHSGLFALLSGARGMGRASAARRLVDAIGMPLLRLDAGAVASPWLGETEKRITRVFEAAREMGAALLIEDADDLFAPRTEVVRSVDRYANMSTNHLLQQVDTFPGLCILTADGTRGFDPAMRRRIAVVVSFPLATLELREQVLKGALDWLRARVEPQRWPPAYDLGYIARVAEGMSPGELVRLAFEVGIRLASSTSGLLGTDEVDPFLAAVIRHQRRAGVVSGDLIDDRVMKKGE